MGGDQDIGEGHQPGEHIVVDRGIGTVFEEVVGFLLIDIESGSADLFFLESLDQGLRIDQGAAGMVFRMNTPGFMVAMLSLLIM